MKMMFGEISMPLPIGRVNIAPMVDHTTKPSAFNSGFFCGLPHLSAADSARSASSDPEPGSRRAQRQRYPSRHWRHSPQSNPNKDPTWG